MLSIKKKAVAAYNFTGPNSNNPFPDKPLASNFKSDVYFPLFPNKLYPFEPVFTSIPNALSSCNFNPDLIGSKIPPN